MDSLRRAGGRSICAKTGKKRYSSYFEAKQADASIRRDVGEDHGSPYACERCGGWHLGRSSSERS
ncbi:MAG: hypothetical protein ACRDJI_11235 [Actinomycetota bacterium]